MALIFDSRWELRPESKNVLKNVVLYVLCILYMHCVYCMYTIYALCMLYVYYMLEMGTNRKTGFLGSLPMLE